MLFICVIFAESFNGVLLCIAAKKLNKMIQAIKGSKWYWYIPIIGFFFISSIADWIFEPKVVQDRHNRNLVFMYYTVLVHSPAAMFFFTLCL